MAFDDFQEKITPNNPSRETSPNRGASLPQEAAIGPDRKSLHDWQKINNIDRDAQIKLKRVSHMRYQHPDLAEITTFLRNFGMSVVKKTDDKRWYKGYGPDQYVYYAQKGEKKFLGGAYEVQSFAELEKASKIAGATQIEELTEAPGGGHQVTLYDPEGFPVVLIYGQEPAPPGPMPEILATNYEVEKPRVAKFQRFKPGPAAVHKLGHYGLCVTDFPAQLQWYTRTFNLVPTDFLYVDEDNDQAKRRDVAAFCHVDIGQEYTDHHTFFMSSNPKAHVHHCSFEVHDFDTQNLGHEWLVSKGYKSVWGVGRHILGSQLFDYWWDINGNMIEHYTDGDLVNEDTPVGWGAAGDESLAVWGPEVPKWFLD
ncbi:Glyoxalase/Bleomycin resistance protein/Dihydroxybiphenyl dioxygenase [Massariosphaeria phaeospora]|uniref:Glyoxalase/Bleomycin resistance protein/Dihydroxybiphenyl dioxygenase n=1 Tax=Massariosphaeria phaeospora TaxID=100035 RepID=A0A7C8I0V2_9PLEO|nr:Glyoxalase/Bleomycin resistance protein/Dihydroxybiphenyl dioxygenase [Massariosphaeria phaeospora]